MSSPRDQAPRETPRDLLQVALAIGSPGPGGRYPVTCRAPDGKVHRATCATWRQACELARDLFVLIAKDLGDAAGELPRVNGVIRH